MDGGFQSSQDPKADTKADTKAALGVLVARQRDRIERNYVFHPFGMKCGGCGGYNVVKK